MIQRNYKKIIIALICLVLFLIPQLFWGKLYQVGGDDTRLYYLFPLEFLKNFTFNIISDNTFGIGGGYGPVSFFAPMTFIFFIFKTLLPFVNIQFFFYGLNLVGGFLAFYFFLGLWIKDDNKAVYCFRIACSLLYVFSPYLIKTLYHNQLLAQYLISIVPAVLYFFIKALQEKRWIFILFSALIYSLFSSTILTLPWFYGFLFSQIPLFIYLGIIYKKRFFIYSSLLVLSIILLNFYWIIHYILGTFLTFHNTNLYSYSASKGFISNNDSTINSLSHMNSPVNQLLGYITAGWNEQLPNIFYYVSSIVIMAIILLAGVKKSKAEKYLQKEYLIFLIGLLWAFFLFTPNMGDWSVSLFLFFNHHIPLFSVVRNMYDKFALAMAFTYATTLFISLVILKKYFIKRKLLMIVCAYFFILIIINAHNFIFPQFTDQTFSTRISGTFNKDYQNLASYIAHLDTNGSHVLWLPLNQANYVAIEDAYNKNHYYFGPSPLRILANVSDFTGFMGITDTYEPELGWKIYALLQNKKYQQIGKILQRLNVKYIIINYQKLPSQGDNFLYKTNMLYVQNNIFKKTILGKKIKDFGNRYSLYNIASQYESNKIYVTDTYAKIPIGSTASFYKLHSYEYIIKLTHISNNIKLVFLDAYDAGWQLHILGSQKILPFQHDFVQNYANGWVINTNYITENYPSTMYQKNKDGSINVTLELFFFPQIIAWIAYGLSGGFALIIILLIAWNSKKNKI